MTDKRERQNMNNSSDAGASPLMDAAEDMVERVARAQARTRIIAAFPDLAKDVLKRDIDLIWRGFVGEARAGIEAMREPTEAMIDSAADNVMEPPCDDYSGGEPLTRSSAKEAWQWMIDAALAEGDSGKAG